MEFLRARFRKSQEQGFTLIEMAIVLVIIGLILGMVFKGRELIASAKVKNTNAGYNKVIAGMNTFYDRYGYFPGDGCETSGETDPMNCDGDRDGIVYGADETTSFFSLLRETGILTDADTKSALGDKWIVGGSDASASWIYVTGADARIVCDLDRVADDANSDTGDIRAGGASLQDTFDGGGEYDSDTDCWDQTGNVGAQLLILP